MTCILVREVCPFCGQALHWCLRHTPLNDRDLAESQHLAQHVEEMIGP